MALRMLIKRSLLFVGRGRLGGVGLLLYYYLSFCVYFSILVKLEFLELDRFEVIVPKGIGVSFDICKEVD